MTKLGITILLATCFIIGQPRDALAFHNCKPNAKGSCIGQPFALPKSVAEYKALRTKWGKDPWAGVQLFLAAMLVHQLNKELGQKLLVLAAHPAALLQRGNWYKGYALRRAQLQYLKPYCMRALVQGTSAKKGYAFNPKKIQLKYRVQTKNTGNYSRGNYKVFIWSRGASTAQPWWVKVDSKGRWKVTNFSSSKANCMKPLVKWNAKTPSAAPKYKNPDDDL